MFTVFFVALAIGGSQLLTVLRESEQSFIMETANYLENEIAIAVEAESSLNPYGPFLNILLMADSALLSLDPDQTSNQDDLDWATLGQIDRRFIGQMRRHAGLAEGPIDD